MNILAELRGRFATALSGLIDDQTELLDAVRRSQDAKFGDYQANCAMPLAKRLGKPPRAIAAEIVERLEIDDLCQPPEIAGPGFINLRMRDEWLAQQLNASLDDARLGVEVVGNPKTYVIDYSAPNVAKPMHVGHIRSTVIGDALARTLRFLGHRVVGDNHVGDWGTQFGMIIYGYKHFLDRAAHEADAVVELARLYRHVSEQTQSDPEIARAVLNETAKLHAGDEENLALWRSFLPACREDIDKVYRRLGVTFDETLGESFYHDRLPVIAAELRERGIAEESDGALCVFFPGEKTPMIIQKQDGAFLYATTDLATIQYRVERWKPDAMLYVVDHRQSLHFKHLFAAARRWGFDKVDFQHISFGAVLGDDGRPFKTRSGHTVGLWGLLDEAVRRAHEIVSTNDDAKPDGPELSSEARERVAEVVGLGALKYADLAHNRTSDYVFSYDKMLATTGNTATYLQYAYARVQNIFARGGVDVALLRGSGAEILLAAPQERALAIELLRLPEALEMMAADCRPNQLTAYLFDQLANRYSSFYEHCPVLKAEDEATRASRLLLCDAAARTLKKGLELLGIDTVEKM